MSLKGGYQIINLRNREFNSEMGNSERYPDIYFNMVNSHAKMIIISGLNMDGVKYNDYEVIFHEEKPEGEDMYFQAIARRIWDTKNYKCITKFINIFSDDRVTCTQSEFIYEILPDSKLSLTSTNALQNKVITQNINRIDSVNERQDTDISNNTTAISKNTSERERNAVLSGIMPTIKLINGAYQELSQTAYLYKYSNGLIILSFTEYIPGNAPPSSTDFFNNPLRNIKIENYYSEAPSYGGNSSPVIAFANYDGCTTMLESSNEGTSLIISAPSSSLGIIASPSDTRRTFYIIITTATNKY